MPSNVQSVLERQRQAYEVFGKPLLSVLAKLHRLTIRDFAEVFGIHRNYADSILKHKSLPSLELALRIARYFEVTVEDLFGWQVDDDGSRRPLLIELPGVKGTVRVGMKNVGVDSRGALDLFDRIVGYAEIEDGFEKLAERLRKGIADARS